MNKIDHHNLCVLYKYIYIYMYVYKVFYHRKHETPRNVLNFINNNSATRMKPEHPRARFFDLRRCSGAICSVESTSVHHQI